jgi:twinkle protein
MINQETIDAINSAIVIEDVVGDYVKLKRQGKDFVGLCPFHKEKTPSFTVSPAKNMFKCFGCGKSGDAIDVVMLKEDISFIPALQLMAKRYNINVEYEGKKEFVKPLPRLEKLDKKKLEFFEQERKISNDTLLRMKVTEGKEFMPQLKGEAPVICFNYYLGDDLVNIKFRGPKKSFKMAKDAESIFYNIDALNGETEAIIVEGEIDVLSLIECGIYNVVGVPNGTPPKGSRMSLEYLDNCWQYFESLQRVIICVDNDEVGRYLKEELGRRIGKERCKVVHYPEDCKDPNDVLVKHGKEAVKSMIKSASDWPLEGIVTMEEIYPLVESYYNDGFPPGAKSSFDGMDELLTFMPGHLTMVTGIPGHGKDEVTNELAVCLAENEGWPWGVFNFEESPAIHTSKLIEKYCKKAFAFRKNQDHRVSRAGFEKGVGFVDHHFKFVNVGLVDVTIQGIVQMAEQLVRRYGIKGLIINPWNYLEHRKAERQSETEYVSEVLTILCNFLSRCNVHCFLIAHPVKMDIDKKTGKTKVPTLYSINGSSHFYNKTHNGICVYRHVDTGQTEIIVQKVKWYWLGHIGSALYYFNTDTRQYNLLQVNRFGMNNSEPPGLPMNKLKKVDLIDHTEAHTVHLNETEEELPF